MPEVVGKYLVIAGVLFIVLGSIFLLAGKIPFIGRLPGDILVRRENFTFYFPITTCILASIILSLLFLFFKR